MVGNVIFFLLGFVIRDSLFGSITYSDAHKVAGSKIFNTLSLERIWILSHIKSQDMIVICSTRTRGINMENNMCGSKMGKKLINN